MKKRFTEFAFIVAFVFLYGSNISYATAPASGGAGFQLSEILTLIANFAIAGGGLWAVWGVIVLAGGLKDKSGPALQSGIWQIIGGGLIISAAAFFQRIAIP